MNQHAIHPRTWIFFAVLLVAVFLLGRSAAQSDSTDLERTVNRIERLSQKSATWDAECTTYFETLRSKTQDSYSKEYFVSKTSALIALSQASQYPGTPLATSQALEQFLEMYEYPTGEGLKALKTSLARLSDCRSVEFYGVLTRLIDPRTRKFFNAGQIDFERRLVLGYLSQETSSGPKLYHQVEKMIDLFAVATDRGLISPSRATRVAINTLRAKKAKASTEWTDNPRENLEDFSALLSMGEEMQEELRFAVEEELEDSDFPALGYQVMNLSGGI